MRSIFVNLPVSDVAASRAFFGKLGLGVNDQFSDESTAHGFMYGRSFTDPDGHVWEVVWMDPSAVVG